MSFFSSHFLIHSLTILRLAIGSVHLQRFIVTKVSGISCEIIDDEFARLKSLCSVDFQVNQHLSNALTTSLFIGHPSLNTFTRTLATALDSISTETAWKPDLMTQRRRRTLGSFWKLRFNFRSPKQASVSSTTQSLCPSEGQGQIFDWHEDVEDLEQYRPGGYHPTYLGDKLYHGRYEIIHKLGYGSYSTVWLAMDHSQEQKRYVAIKILKAQAFSAEEEIKCWQHLQDGPSDHPGRRYITALDNFFSLWGPNGCHNCLVMPVAGCNLYNCNLPGASMFKADQARAIAARILLGLSYIHSRGVIHGGKC